MNFNFTDKVRVTLGSARKEAIRLRHDFVGPGHMALALFSPDAPMVDLPPEQRMRVRASLERTFQPGKAGKGARLGELPYTSRAKKVLEGAMAEARERKDRYVGIEHLFLGVIAADPVVAGVLESCGVTTATVLGVPGEPAGDGSAAALGAEPEVWYLRLDATAEIPLYEQIIRGVQEAVATGKLGEGERLPPVRQLAAELEIAPGTVARAYQALEENGVVVTEGARGTRIAPRDHRRSPDDERATALEGLFRSAVVAAYHMGARAKDVRAALDRAMKGIYGLLG